MNLIDSLNWRYATKRMNGAIVPEEKINTILEAIRLSASSFGLQPYRVLVVSSKEMKEKIHLQACHQPQIIEASHVLVFASFNEINDSHIDEYMNRTANERNVPVESLAQFKDFIKGFIVNNSAEINKEWATKQAYIGLGFGLTAAAMEQVDATPMEGFNPSAIDQILGLTEKNLRSVVMLTLGYRDTENDYLAKAKKVRLGKDEFFITV